MRSSLSWYKWSRINSKGGVAMSFEELQSRIGILEDIEAIRKLKANYAYLQDTGDMQEFANLFVDDAVMDFGTFGRYEGKAECVRFVRDIILGT